MNETVLWHGITSAGIPVEVVSGERCTTVAEFAAVAFAALCAAHPASVYRSDDDV